MTGNIESWLRCAAARMTSKFRHCVWCSTEASGTHAVLDRLKEAAIPFRLQELSYDQGLLGCSLTEYRFYVAGKDREKAIAKLRA